MLLYRANSKLFSVVSLMSISCSNSVKHFFPAFYSDFLIVPGEDIYMPNLFQWAYIYPHTYYLWLIHFICQHSLYNFECSSYLFSELSFLSSINLKKMRILFWISFVFQIYSSFFPWSLMRFCIGTPSLPFPACLISFCWLVSFVFI